MKEIIKARWLTDHEQNKIAPKTLSTQILNEDGTHFKDTLEASLNEISKSIPSLDGYATEEYVENLYTKLNTNTVLGFYCIEDVTIVVNGISKVYSANSNVEIKFIEDDVFEIIPTSDNSILSLSAFPGALGTFYPWLEGVAQFSNILFDMNAEDMYTKWNQGNQGSYHVQSAQYINCIFWSDNPYISDISKRTNYTLTHTSQLPLCYSSIPDNTFKSFYLAFGVNSDPNWGNKAYRDSFAKATWATQAFSYYGARVIGIVGHDNPDFNITLPKDCRGLMFDARDIESAGVFDAVNTTNFGAKSGSWREAFGDCTSLRRLYIKNLKVNLNISWSPIDYNSIYFIISEATNTSAITISVSPYTYNLLGPSDFELAASKNITIALLTSNYVEDRRLSDIANKADKTDIVNADWNQNDETAGDYIKNKPDIAALQNLVGDTPVADQISDAISEIDMEVSWDDIQNRPFGEDKEITYLLSETTVEVGESMESLPAVALEVGKSYTVIFNGAEYECVAITCSDIFSGNEIVAIGNGTLLSQYGFENDDPGNGEPFACIVNTYSLDLMTSETGTHTISVASIEKTIHQIDSKYLPDIGGTDITPLTDEEIDAICDFDGEIESDVIPVASKATLGCVVAGDGVNIDENGVISVAECIQDSVPIGSIVEWNGDIVPENWLLLNGQAVSRTGYAELFALYGTKYGEGDGSTTFNLPDYRKRVPVGMDETDTDFDELGNTGGEKEHTLTGNEMPKHQHLVIATSSSGSDYSSTGSYLSYTYSTSNVGYQGKTSYTGGDNPHNNLQPYIVTNFIVKAKLYTSRLLPDGMIVDSLTSDSSTDALSALQGKTLNEQHQALKQMVTKDLLWENASPSSDFAAQIISLDLSGYYAVDVIYTPNAGSDADYTQTIRIGKNTGLDTCRSVESTTSGLFHTYRNCWVTATGVQFGAGGFKYAPTTSYTQMNNYSVPLVIYGIKEVV